MMIVRLLACFVFCMWGWLLCSTGCAPVVATNESNDAHEASTIHDHDAQEASCTSNSCEGRQEDHPTPDKAEASTDTTQTTEYITEYPDNQSPPEPAPIEIAADTGESTPETDHPSKDSQPTDHRDADQSDSPQITLKLQTDPAYPNISDASSRSLLPTIVTLEYQANQLLVQPIIFGTNGQLTYGRAMRLPLLDYTWPKTKKAVTALDENDLYIVKFASEVGPFTIERHRLFSLQASKKYTLQTRRPTALFARKGQLYIGGIEAFLTRVDTIDFRRTFQQYTPRFTAKDSYRQEIDDFAIAGDTLIAIDNVVIPKFAFVFDISPDGSFRKHLFTAYLPVTIDGTYPEGVANGDQLYLRGKFENGHGLGSGQSLIRLKMNKADIREEVTIAEHLPANGLPDPTQDLFHGTQFSEFQGMETLGSTLLIGAGARGIFVFDMLFKRGDKGTRFDPGGGCTDLTRISGEIYALVQTSTQTQLVQLTWDAASQQVKVKHRINLPGRPTRFTN